MHRYRRNLLVTESPRDSVSLTAAPSGGSVFNNWSGACTGTNPNSCKITLNSNQTLTANITPPPDFSVSPATTNLSVKRGSQVSEVLTFGAQGGFSGTIALTCSVTGVAPTPTCGFSPSSVTAGSSSTLTVDTAGLSATLAPQLPGMTAKLYAASLPFGALAFLLGATSCRKRRRAWILGIAFLSGIVVSAGCGSGGSNQPHFVAQSYTVTVTATSGTIQHSRTINVTVN